MLLGIIVINSDILSFALDRRGDRLRIDEVGRPFFRVRPLEKHPV